MDKTDRYQLRDGFFKGPGTYGVDLNDGTRHKFEVDEQGYFDFPRPRPAAIALMARCID
jgi:hypothetical protein